VNVRRRRRKGHIRGSWYDNFSNPMLTKPSKCIQDKGGHSSIMGGAYTHRKIYTHTM
jgi:hypothetical protein